MQNEIWKSVKGFEGIYEISNFGNLKSFKKEKNGYILSNVNKKKGYVSVILKSKELKKSTRIHRLVAETFLENPENKSQVNHINGIKNDNRLVNLEWCTSSENVNHSIRMNENQLNGMINYNQNIRPKKIVQKSLSGLKIEVFNNSKEAFLKTGVCARNILQVASKTEYKKGLKRSQAGGYKWDFL